MHQSIRHSLSTALVPPFCARASHRLARQHTQCVRAGFFLPTHHPPSWPGGRAVIRHSGEAVHRGTKRYVSGSRGGGGLAYSLVAGLRVQASLAGRVQGSRVHGRELREPGISPHQSPLPQLRGQRRWLVVGSGCGGSGPVVHRAPVTGTSRQSFACESVSAVPTLELRWHALAPDTPVGGVASAR